MNNPITLCRLWISSNIMLKQNIYKFIKLNVIENRNSSAVLIPDYNF